MNLFSLIISVIRVYTFEQKITFVVHCLCPTC